MKDFNQASAGSLPSPSLTHSFAAPAAVHSHLFLFVEFAALFLALPLALFFHLITHIPPLPILWTVAIYALIVLLRDPTFDRRQLWNPGPLRQQLPQILALFAAGVIVVSVLVHLYAPNLFLALPRTHPGLWALILVLYPVLSVIPQALLYRAFLFHRYRPLLNVPPRTRSFLLIVVSAATFALMHIVFHNWIAIALTFPGGILFATRYVNTRSLSVSILEHALYGCFLFTIGLGPFFYARVV